MKVKVKVEGRSGTGVGTVMDDHGGDDNDHGRVELAYGVVLFSRYAISSLLQFDRFKRLKYLFNIQNRLASTRRL